MVFLEIEIVSHFKIESAFFELVVFVRVEAEQLGWAMPPSHLCFLEWYKQAEAQDLLSKITFIQVRSQNGFVKVLEL